MSNKYIRLPSSRQEFIESLRQIAEIESEGVCLDLGCGDGWSKEELENLGYVWVGGDISPSSNASAVCDGHHLPFPDDCFDLVISYATLEHFHAPWLAIKEISRCCKPRALFAGTCAFLEPFHAESYFHMSHLGLEKILNEGGFEVLHIWPGWHVLEAQAQLFHVRFLYRFRNLGRFLAPKVASLLHRMRFQAHKKNDPHCPDDWPLVDTLSFSGSIGFLARNNAT